MLITILCAIVLVFITIINFLFFFTTSGKQMVQEITDQRLIGKIGIITIYLPAFFARFTVNFFKRSYRAHKTIYNFIGEFIVIFIAFIAMFALYILLYILGF